MSDAVSIEWPKQDVRALWAQIDRAQKELGKGLGPAIRFAAWSVARSLGVLTKVAPKYRPYKVIKEGRGVAKGKGGKKYEVTSWKKGHAKTFNIRAASVSELKKKGQVRIGNAGLAKSAWMRGVKKLGSGSGIGMKGVTPGAKRRAAGNMDVTQRLRGDDPFVKIINSLPYAASALKGGMSAVNGAMGSAARSMEKIVDANITKKLGAK
jgi:hypothetical protein